MGCYNFNILSIQEKKSATRPPSLKNTRKFSSSNVDSETKNYSNSKMASQQQDSPYGDSDSSLSFNIPGKLGLLGKV